MRLLSFLKHPAYFLVFLGITFLVFDIHWYVMSTLPGHRDEMCLVGGNFTPLNIAFAVTMAVLSGLLAVGFVGLFKGVLAPAKSGRTAQKVRSEKRRFFGAHSFLGGLGAAFGFLTVFCTICTIPVVTLFGLSVGLQVFVQYDPFIKIASLLLMALACWLINRQMEQRCLICAQ